MFQAWIAQALKRSEMGRVASLYAHSAFLWQNLEPDDLTPDVVVHLLSSQLFVTTRFRSQAEAASGSKPNKPPTGTKAATNDAADSELGIPDSDLFDMFQKLRGMLLRYGGRPPDKPLLCEHCTAPPRKPLLHVLTSHFIAPPSLDFLLRALFPLACQYNDT